MENKANSVAAYTEALERIVSCKAQNSNFLDLSDLKLATLPPEIGQLGNLKSLSLAENGLTTLPPEVGKLTGLTNLNVSRNKLRTLPREIIGRLKALKRLDLSDNFLITLPPEIGLLTSLELLEANSNRLKSLPEDIGLLQELRFLGVGNNYIESVTNKICSLKNLMVLVLAMNDFDALPEEIGNLSNLIELHAGAGGYSLSERALRLKMAGISGIRGDDITKVRFIDKLPKTIGSLKKLEVLDISGHNISELPREILSLKSLKRLTLHGNHRLGLTSEMMSSSLEDVWDGFKPTPPQAILDYYFRISTLPATPLNEGKMILVGRGSVGKTSLVRRLRENKFDVREKKTDGIRIEPWEISCTSQQKVLLHVWDFGGQEIMHATHRFFLTKRSLYLVVLNGREGGEDADAEYWLKTINALAPESPVLVVLNKHLSHPASLNRTGLCIKYPNVCGFVETDCGSKPRGIADLKRAIKKAVRDHLPDARAKFPASWSKIKDELSQMRKILRKDFITFDEYRSLCARHKEIDPVAQENLAGFLNDLGIALNYKDDPRLSDKHVLNPQWVTEGIYKILNAPTLAKAGGELHLKQVSTILGNTDYPKAMHAFIFDLMRKFELCFHFPERDGEYLIPELLSKNEPPAAQRFREEAGATRFFYKYEILPEGLIPRFIVRTYVHSEGKPRWRTGVILNFEGNSALVWADVAEGKVEIIVTGETKSRRRLLAVIRSQLEHIHNHLKLQPREEVPVPNVNGLVMDYGALLTYESANEPTPRVPFKGELHTIDVAKLLNGLDIEGARSVKNNDPKAVRLFYSYSSNDEEFRAELETHLSLLKRQGKLATWSMRQIVPGTEWDKTIDENLKSADIILLMVSSDFLASDYIYDVEVKQAMDQHKNGKSHVIPVIIRNCSWTDAPFGTLQGVPKGKAIKLWPDRDSAWREVSDWIRKIVDERIKTSP